jgi:hypothetical protein
MLRNKDQKDLAIKSEATLLYRNAEFLMMPCKDRKLVLDL